MRFMILDFIYGIDILLFLYGISDLGSSFWGMVLILASTNLLTAKIAAGCFAFALLVVLFVAKNVSMYKSHGCAKLCGRFQLQMWERSHTESPFEIQISIFKFS